MSAVTLDEDDKSIALAKAIGWVRHQIKNHQYLKTGTLMELLEILEGKTK